MMENQELINHHLVAIGIGGSGAKCIEALVQLAVSGHVPRNVYPILIDQDRENGNVNRCKNALQAYADLRKESNVSTEWFFASTFNIYDKLLPLLPQEDSKNYGAAIGLPSMKNHEEEVTKALFLPNQLKETLDSGYKKRAHMGSLLIEQMLEKEDKKTYKEEGLNFIIDKIKGIPNPLVIIYGSLFGGTGASGMIRIGKYFKDRVPNAIIKGVFLTPYFLIGRSSDSDKDADLVKSDADMQAVKISFQIYKDEMEKSFHNIYLIGSEISKLEGEFATEEANYGGRKQENPAHLFELIAAMTSTSENLERRSKYFAFISQTDRVEPPLTFSISPKYPKKEREYNAIINLGLNAKRIAITRDFANMLYKTRDNNEKSWWLRQPWVNIKFKTDLINWGKRHLAWWYEMSTEGWDNHGWEKYPLFFDIRISEYDYSSYLSKYIGTKRTNNLASLFLTINSFDKIKFRRLKWEST